MRLGWLLLWSLTLVLAACGSDDKVNQGKTLPDMTGQDTLLDDTQTTDDIPSGDLGIGDASDLVEDVPVEEVLSPDVEPDMADQELMDDDGNLWEEWDPQASGSCSAEPATFVSPRLSPLPVPAMTVGSSTTPKHTLVPDLYSPWQLGRAEGAISHMDPLAPSLGLKRLKSGEEIVMPQYEDEMPLVVQEFQGQKRCYELPDKAVVLTEAQAYDLYRAMAERTTGHPFDSTPERRSVVGLRGSSGRVFLWNNNVPNKFNDTLVLLWREQSGQKRVLEFPVNTDTGVNDFGYHNSSSLWPNRHYPYRCGWHKNYNALAIDITDYQVRDDMNKNGHWDSDRNEWLDSPLGVEGEDHDRPGSAHNIHMGSMEGTVESATVDYWSAGCQVIPGRANWEMFIYNAWTHLGDEVDYYLLDIRDVDPTVWQPCQPDGSHACPFYVDQIPFAFEGNTGITGENAWNGYNCSSANEGGPELVFVWRTQSGGNVRALLNDVSGDATDIDIHLLMGDDPKACMARDDVTFDAWVPQGRYVFIADTFVGGGEPQVGEFQLNLDWVPGIE